MTILDGIKTAKELEVEVKDSILEIEDKLKLVVIKIGDDKSSEVYVNKKMKKALELGFDFELISYDDTVTNETVINKIKELNSDNNVTGIMVQLPIAKHLDVELIMNTINPIKDVDGLTNYNLGATLSNSDGINSCTPLGIMYLLEKYNIDLVGKNICVIGKSNIVGKPVALLLMNKGATVVVCNSKTKNLKEHTLKSDIIISAVGKKHLVTEDMISDNTIVVDAGIIKENNKLYGDVDFDNVSNKCSYITPVPGGVGPMTVACLMKNVINCYYLQKKEKQYE